MRTKLPNYYKAVCWFLLSLVCSVMNDVISKYMGSNLGIFQIAFFRFLFSALTLLPVIFYYGFDTLKSSNFLVHFIRGAILYFGITLWIFGLNSAPVSVATIISFTIPLFTLILARIFLKENVHWYRWLATIIGFCGILIIVAGKDSELTYGLFLLVLSGIGFAGLDVINKKFVIQETMISMLFYSAIVTTALSLPAALYEWKEVSFNQICLLCLLGASANLILFFILKAFALADASAIAPYRYIELILSSLAGYIFFSEFPSNQALYGTIIIIPATLFIVYSEKKVLTN